MNLIRRDKTQAALQKTYDDAYQSSLQAIILETENDREAALESWNSTLNSISMNMSNFIGRPPKSTTEQGLMSSILDIERQCHDRISFLESRRYPPTSPYMNAYSTSSSTLNNPSTSSYNSTSKISQSDLSSYGRPSLLNVPRKNLPSKSDPLLLQHQPVSYPTMYNHKRSQSHSATPPQVLSSQYTLPPQTAPPPPPLPPSVPPQPPSHRTPTSSSSTLVPIPPTPTLRSKSVTDLPPAQPKSMMKTLRTSGRSGRIVYPRGNTSSASAAATLAWSADTKPGQAQKTSQAQPRSSSNGHAKSYSSSNTITTTVVRPVASRPNATRSSTSAIPKSQPSLIDESPPLIDLSTEVIQPIRSKSQPAVQKINISSLKITNKPGTPPLPASRTQPTPPTTATIPRRQSPAIPTTIVRRQSPALQKPATQSRRSSPAPANKPTSNITTTTTTTKVTPQQAALKRSMASNTLSSTATKPTPKPGPKPKTGPKPKSSTTTTTTTTTTEKPESADEEWERIAKEKVKTIRGIDENAASQILNEIVLKGDEVHWEDIAGLEQAKASLKEAVVYPFLRPDLFSGLREPARGMLLFGPPGTGKTMLARAVATESKSTFFSISASSLTSKFLGESEKLVRALFQMAKAFAPSIIFVDEIDSLLSTRSENGEHEASRRIKNEFLVQWSDLQHAAAGRDNGDDLERVLVLAATNLPWGIDEAARRRFVRRQYIPLPERETRAAHLQKLLSNQKHALTETDFQKLVDLTDGFSGSDMTALAKDAAMGPLRSLGEALLTTPRDQIRPMGIEDFVSSLGTIRPSVSKEGLKAFEDWADLYGSSGA